MTIYVAGVDEVGRGPLAGPVITAAVIINTPIAGVTDSKKLTATKRQQLSMLIKAQALSFAFGRAEVEEVDALNIHHATLLAMKRAVEALAIRPHKVLVDGLYKPAINIDCETIINGDALIFEIAAASILAKVARDAEMEMMEAIYPGYGFAKHKGYATELHRRALRELGPCAIHRKSYAPIAALLPI